MKRILTAILSLAVILCAGCSGGTKAIVMPTAAAPPSATEAAKLTYAEVQAPVDAAWFDDAVMVGDSVTLKLSYYCESHPEALGQAQFFCAGSLGYTNALWDLDNAEAVHPYFKGAIHLTEECAEQTGARKAFIMLGMNDVGLYGADGALDSAKKLIANIENRSPNVLLYIQSATPILTGHDYICSRGGARACRHSVFLRFSGQRQEAQRGVFRHQGRGDPVGYERVYRCQRAGSILRNFLSLR